MPAIQEFGIEKQKIPVPPVRATGGGLTLGNASLQFFRHDIASLVLQQPLSPTAKLEALKRRHFTTETKAERIAKSLAALHQPETLNLLREDWRYFAENPDLEDQD
jgi:hypothetical protein